jgi:hypothetical protein
MPNMERIRKEIRKELLRSEVFRAVGDNLKDAMIAQKIMGIQYAQDFQGITIERYTQLYDELRKDLLESWWQKVDLTREVK